MSLWVITDTHLGHKAMLKFTWPRPGNFEEKILSSWATNVKAGDTVIHLGDVAFKGREQVRHVLALPGRKVLVRGNHDYETTKWYMDNGFELVVDSLTMEFMGVKILFSHRPIPNFGYADVNIHGHMHDIHRFSTDRLYIPLALEVQGYAPILMNDKFFTKIRSWSDKFKQDGSLPSPKEIAKLGPHPIEKLRECDVSPIGHRAGDSTDGPKSYGSGVEGV